MEYNTYSQTCNSPAAKICIPPSFTITDMRIVQERFSSCREGGKVVRL